MAVTITDTRTTPTNAEADATTGWTGTATLNLFTTDPDPVEATGSLGMAVSTSTQDLYVSISSTNLSSTLIYVWTLANGTMDTRTNGGVATILYDGTNRIGYHIAGSDVAGFRHETGPVGWQCQVIDTANLPGTTTARAGSAGSLNLAALTGIGAMYKTLSKALGGASNCFTDVIRYGTGGLRITAGTSGDTGKFSEIAAADRSSTTGQAYGIIRQLASGVFGLQGPLTFGDTTGSTTTFFADTNATVVFESRGIGTSRYFITVQGNATGSTTFRLGTKVGSTSGSNGCSLVCPSGIGASFTATDADLQFLLLYGSSLSGFNNGVSFSADATNGPNHEIFDCTFSGCGQIDPGKIQFKNNSIASTTDFATGAVLLDADSTGNWDTLSFTSGGTGHAIYITATGSHNITNSTFTGYAVPTVFGFNTTSDVDEGTDTVAKTAHGYATEDPIHYMKQGGTANMGLTDATTYYVRAITANTIAFYTSAANAASDTGRIALTPTGGETHYINPINAVFYNNSGGAVTLVSSGNTGTLSVRNGASATTTITSSVNVAIHVQDAAGAAVVGAQVYIQKTSPTVFTSGAGNTAGDGDIVVTQTIDSDIPSSGYLRVFDQSLTLNGVQGYRYTSHDGANTFTFGATFSGTTTSAGTATQLIDSTADFGGTDDIEEGDTIRNTTDTSYAVVDEIVSTTELRTSELSAGSDNTWQSGDGYSVNDLATTLVSGTDLIDVPLFNGQTNGTGDIATTYGGVSDQPVKIRIRSNNEATKYIPFDTSATITVSGGLGLTATYVLTEDTVAT